MSPLLETGQLVFLSGNDVLISELLVFSNATYDNLVDERLPFAAKVVVNYARRTGHSNEDLVIWRRSD
ncbi:hypothetical protein [Cyanobium sp. ULC082]